MKSPLFPTHAPGFRRREWLRAGGLGALGLSLPALWKASAAGPAARPASFGRAKSCILLFLTGGPPQHETFDPKPDAPLEIRGTFRPISHQRAGRALLRDAAATPRGSASPRGHPLDDHGHQRPLDERRLHAHGLRAADQGRERARRAAGLAEHRLRRRRAEAEPAFAALLGDAAGAHLTTTATSSGPARTAASWARPGIPWS